MPELSSIACIANGFSCGRHHFEPETHEFRPCTVCGVVVPVDPPESEPVTATQTERRLAVLEARTELAREILDGRRDDLIQRAYKASPERK